MIQSAPGRESFVLMGRLYHQPLKPPPTPIPWQMVFLGPVQCDSKQGAGLDDGSMEKPVQSGSIVQEGPIWWRTLYLGPKDGEELQRGEKRVRISSPSDSSVVLESDRHAWLKLWLRHLQFTSTL